MAKTSDITKQAWKFQEGAVYLALSEVLIGKNNVWWNHQCDFTPEGMSIDPDILIGNDPKNPDAIIFVTHASAERAGEKKFWRTVAEVIEIKRLKLQPKVLSILFAGNVKANLMVAYEQLFDGVYHMDSTPEGKDVSELIMRLTKKHGTQQPLECLELLKRDFIHDSAYWDPFVAQVSRLAKSAYGPKHKLMVAISQYKKSRLPNARETSLRRSSCKLFTLPVDLRQNLMKHKTTKSVPIHAQILGWFNKGIGGYRLVDEELAKFIRDSDSKTIDIILDEANKLSIYCSFVENLKGIETRKFCNEWIIENYDELCTTKGMLRYLEEVFEDPYQLLHERIAEELCPKTHWLFETMINLLRTETGRADGYGYSVLGNETGHGEINAHPGVIIAPFQQRKKMLSLPLIRDISRVFGEHLKRIGISRCSELLDQADVTFCHSIFNYNIATYRHFNPLEWLVSGILTANDFDFEYPQLHPSFLSDEAIGITTTTGNIMKVLGGDIWIKCQSAYDGKTDKRKELCGRIGAMKLSYSLKQLKKKRFFLVIDGFFNDEDLHLLDQAGWDGIYYYDELDLLIEEIRRSRQ